MLTGSHPIVTGINPVVAIKMKTLAMTPIKSFIILLILSSLTSTAQAQKSVIPDINAKGQRGEIARKMQAKSSQQFLRADTNQDYLISQEEAALQLKFISKKFSHYDKNRDGSLSWQEFLGHNEWPAPVHRN